MFARVGLYRRGERSKRQQALAKSAKSSFDREQSAEQISDQIPGCEPCERFPLLPEALRDGQGA